MALLLAGCGMRVAAGSEPVVDYRGPSEDAYIFRYTHPEPPEMTNWALTSWPDREPLAFDITTVALDGGLEHDIRIAPREGLEHVWYGIYFDGLLSPESGAGLAPAAYLSTDQWLWRVSNNPPPDLAYLEVVVDIVRLGVTAPIERPDAGSDVLELTAGGSRCDPSFTSDPARHVQFICPGALTVPVQIELTIRPGVVSPGGGMLEPRSVSMLLEAERYMFPATGPPPVPPELCVDGLTYFPSDC